MSDSTKKAEETLVLNNLRKVLESFWIRGSFSRYDEVYPGIYVGDLHTAKNIPLLRDLGVTHILNAAYEPVKPMVVDTSNQFYEKHKFKCTFRGLIAIDMPTFPIKKYFDEASEFIDDALTGGGKVLVHCFMGVSRSTTLVIAFLMQKRNMSASSALELVKTKRSFTLPNSGFLEQLAGLEVQLRPMENSYSG